MARKCNAFYFRGGHGRLPLGISRSRTPPGRTRRAPRIHLGERIGVLGERGLGIVLELLLEVVGGGFEVVPHLLELVGVVRGQVEAAKLFDLVAEERQHFVLQQLRSLRSSDASSERSFADLLDLRR